MKESPAISCRFRLQIICRISFDVMPEMVFLSKAGHFTVKRCFSAQVYTRISRRAKRKYGDCCVYVLRELPLMCDWQPVNGIFNKRWIISCQKEAWIGK